MKQYDISKPLISIHIPKCAGTSFIEVLNTWFKKVYFHYPNEKRGKAPKQHKLTHGLLKKRPIESLCIHGHFNNARGYGVSDYYPEIDQFITILRDPFDIHISVYRHLKSRGARAHRDGARVTKATDENYDIIKHITNARSYIMQFLPREININNYKEIIEQNFVYIGITEDLQNSVNVLARRLGHEAVVVPKKNISTHHEDIPSGLREEFILNNPLEYAIYNYALERYMTP